MVRLLALISVRSRDVRSGGCGCGGGGVGAGAGAEEHRCILVQLEGRIENP